MVRLVFCGDNILMKKRLNQVTKNTFMLYIMAVVKLILPLLTLPYLTRVLSEETYGFVSYVKSCMIYMTLIIDFGFILSSVKDIVNTNGDLEEIGKVVGNTFFSKFLLAILSGCVLVVMCIAIPILQIDIVFVVLSFLAVATTLFLADFLFRGIEKMHYITIIFLITKSVSTLLTFILVKDDSTILWIPVLDILAHVIAVVITFIILKKLKIKVRMTGIKDCLLMIKDSFTYFLSNIASTAFTALNTLLIGIYIKDLAQIAHWSLCINIIGAIQGLYAPICNGIYPYMIKKKNLSFIHKILLLLMPIVGAGCLLCFFLSKFVLLVLGGEKYVEAYMLFRWLIPVLFFSFPVQLFGWPTLGAISKEKETTATTIFSAIIQVIGLVFLIIIGHFNLVALAILRCGTELILLLARMFIVYKNKRSFCGNEMVDTM